MEVVGHSTDAPIGLRTVDEVCCDVRLQFNSNCYNLLQGFVCCRWHRCEPERVIQGCYYNGVAVHIKKPQETTPSFRCCDVSMEFGARPLTHSVIDRFLFPLLLSSLGCFAPLVSRFSLFICPVQSLWKEALFVPLLMPCPFLFLWLFLHSLPSFSLDDTVLCWVLSPPSVSRLLLPTSFISGQEKKKKRKKTAHNQWSYWACAVKAIHKADFENNFNRRLILKKKSSLSRVMEIKGAIRNVSRNPSALVSVVCHSIITFINLFETDSHEWHFLFTRWCKHGLSENGAEMRVFLLVDWMLSLALLMIWVRVGILSVVRIKLDTKQDIMHTYFSLYCYLYVARLVRWNISYLISFIFRLSNWETAHWQHLEKGGRFMKNL